MNQWFECLLGDVITLKRGYDLPGRDRKPGPFPIVSSSGVTDYHSEAKVKGPGVVTGRYGTIGEVYYVEGDFWPLNTSLYVQDFKGNDPRFISYFLRTLGLDTQNAAGAVPGVNRNHLHQMRVRIPDIVTQRKIASILSAYDDLIENNTRRIEILEEMVRTIYREWFVNFRFPGHEKVKMVNSELGPIPEGCEVRTVGDTFNIMGGGTPSTQCPEYWEDGNINWYTPSDLTSSGDMFLAESSKKITDEGLQKSSAKIFPPYSVMMTSRATIGVVAINSTPATTNQGFIICLPNDVLSVYNIYQWIIENREKIIGIASGATFKEINRTEFRELPIVIADTSTREQWLDVVAPICQQIEILGSKNRNLRKTREMLLPQLVSGKIDVLRPTQTMA